MKRGLAAVVLHLATRGSGAGRPAAEGSPRPSDAHPRDAGACVLPAVDPPWLESYLSEIVGKLAGAVVLAARSTLAERAATRSIVPAGD